MRERSPPLDCSIVSVCCISRLLMIDVLLNLAVVMLRVGANPLAVEIPLGRHLNTVSNIRPQLSHLQVDEPEGRRVSQIAGHGYSALPTSSKKVMASSSRRMK